MLASNCTMSVKFHFYFFIFKGIREVHNFESSDLREEGGFRANIHISSNDYYWISTLNLYCCTGIEEDEQQLRRERKRMKNVVNFFQTHSKFYYKYK